MQHEQLKARTVNGAFEEMRRRIRQDGREASPHVRELLKEMGRRLADLDFDAGTIEGVSPEQLGRFRLETGYDANTYLDQRRLELAHHLVCETAEPLGAISQGLGFRTTDHFSKWFKRRLGVAPEVLRGAQCSSPGLAPGDEPPSEDVGFPDLARWRLFMMGLIGPEEACRFAEALESRYHFEPGS